MAPKRVLGSNGHSSCLVKIKLVLSLSEYFPLKLFFFSTSIYFTALSLFFNTDPKSHDMPLKFILGHWQRGMNQVLKQTCFDKPWQKWLSSKPLGLGSFQSKMWASNYLAKLSLSSVAHSMLLVQCILRPSFQCGSLPPQLIFSPCFHAVVCLTSQICFVV